MQSSLRKAVLAAAFVTLAPGASLFTGTASDADAHTFVSGSVSFGTPVAVVGYSYGNPFQYGPVYQTPYECNVGPVYYYPAYRVYAPRYPVYRYYDYARPTYYYQDRRYGARGYDYGHNVYSRRHDYRNYRYSRGHDDRNYRYSRGHDYGNHRYSRERSSDHSYGHSYRR